MGARGMRNAVETAAARALLRLPRAALRAIAGRPIVRDGRTLDVQAQVTLRAAEIAGKKPSWQMTIAEARADIDVSGGQLGPRPRGVRTEERTIGGFRARVYNARNSDGGGLVFFHGGGHVIGSLDSHDAPCRQIAAQTPCTVVSVDYRLAPEHPFPAAADDATASFRAVVREAASLGIDPKRIAIGGDSAGANIAAVAALDTRDDAARPCFQLLVYPVVDATFTSPSIEKFADGFFLEKKTMEWFRGHYLGDGDRKQPRMSPIYAESLAGLPPALVMTAGFDPLRDEGDEYAKRLRDAGVPTQHESYGGLFHGFFNTSGVIHAARGAFDDAVTALRAAIRPRE
ncbi:MAG TPA: alpha/beta hydrolase [Labilithrix sp.]